MQTTTADMVYDLDGAARRLNTTTRHVRALVYRDEIPYFKLGGKLRFVESRLATHIDDLMSIA